jgi:hypothetical protein
LGGFGYGVFMRKMRIAANEGNSRHIAARITHPDGQENDIRRMK